MFVYGFVPLISAFLFQPPHLAKSYVERYTWQTVGKIDGRQFERWSVMHQTLAATGVARGPLADTCILHYSMKWKQISEASEISEYKSNFRELVIGCIGADSCIFQQ